MFQIFAREKKYQQKVKLYFAQVSDQLGPLLFLAPNYWCYTKNRYQKCTILLCCIYSIIISTHTKEQWFSLIQAQELTLLSCISRLAPFFKSTSVAPTLLTAAAQCRADLPKKNWERTNWCKVYQHDYFRFMWMDLNLSCLHSNIQGCFKCQGPFGASASFGIGLDEDFIKAENSGILTTSLKWFHMLILQLINSVFKVTEYMMFCQSQTRYYIKYYSISKEEYVNKKFTDHGHLQHWCQRGSGSALPPCPPQQAWLPGSVE